MSDAEFNIPSLDPIAQIFGNTQIICYDSTSPDTVKHKNTTFVDINEFLINNLIFTEGLKLSASRKALCELKTSGLSTDGDYVIAQTDTESGNEYVGSFLVTATGDSISDSFIVDICCHNSSDAKTIENTDFTVRNLSKESQEFGILNFDLAKNDTTIDAGFKLLCNLNINVGCDITVQKVGNVSATSSGWVLVSATQTDNDKTPDGSTATLLRALERNELTPGRKFVNEKATTSITAPGNYVLAKTGIESGGTYSTLFLVTTYGANVVDSFLVVVHAFDFTSDLGNKIEILSGSKMGSSGINYFRLGYSFSADNTGFTFLANIAVPTDFKITCQCLGNIADGSTVAASGWDVIEATTIDNDKTPSGATASFLDSGKDHNFMKTGTTLGVGVGVVKISDDAVRLTYNMDYLPMPGANNLSVSFGSASATIRGNAQIFTLNDVDFEYGLVDIKGKQVAMSITQAGFFTTFSPTHAYFLRVVGSDFTISLDT